MNPRYIAWITEKLKVSDPLGMCRAWTLEMQEQFAELKRVRGHVFLTSGLYRVHWWLVDEHDQIVDPTVAQFSSSYFGHRTRVLQYEPRDESEPEPTGTCPNCSGYCFNNQTCCSEKCNLEYAAYVMGA